MADGWLAALGGSWHDLPAGLGLLSAGVQLSRGRTSGACWHGAVFALTVAWTACERGLDDRPWVPRLGLVLVLMFVIAPRAAVQPRRVAKRVLRHGRRA
ncbi:MAG: membrane-bound PQQ-dependent dehydrogenase, glucose/quinate/shikimate family, partial [Pseudoxanthomonas sp.]